MQQFRIPLTSALVSAAASVLDAALRTQAIVSNQVVHLVGDVNLSSDQRELLSLGSLFVPSDHASVGGVKEEILNSLEKLTRRVRIHHCFKHMPARLPFSVADASTCVASIDAHWRARMPNWRPPTAPASVERSLARMRRAAAAACTRATIDAAHAGCNIPSRLHAATRQLQASTFIVRTADKNVGTAVMSPEWYDAAVHVHLDNAANYTRTTLSETAALTDMKRCLSSVCLGAVFNPRVVQRIAGISGPCALPRFYVIPKVHKLSPGSPFASRPIAANHSAPTRAAAQLLSNVLQPIVWSSEWVLKDTLALVRFLEHSDITADLSANDAIFTVDVEALYPSMDIDTTVRITRVRLLRHFGRCALVDVLSNLLAVVLHTGFVSYDGVVYKQTSGIPMGVSCCTHLGNLYVEHFLSPILRRWQQKGCVRWARGYIDDIVGVWRGSRAEFTLMLDDLNSAHASLKVTSDFSYNGLPFLDLLIHKGPRACAEHRWDFRVHSKELNQHLYIPASSAHPPRCLPAFIRGEVMRFVRNSSQREYAVSTAHAFSGHLAARGYDVSMITAAFATVRYSDRESMLRERNTGHGDAEPQPVLPLIAKYTAATAAMRRDWFHAEVEQLVDRTHRGVVAWKRATPLHTRLRLQWPRVNAAGH